MSLTWKQRYRKNFWATRSIILAFCDSVAFSLEHAARGRRRLPGLVMELGAFVGSMWTTRLVGKFDRAKRDKIDLKVM